MVAGRVLLIASIIAVCLGSHYKGCYKDTADRAILMKRVDDHAAMSIRKCQAICSKDGYLYAAVQAGFACFCGDSGYGRYGKVDDSECNTPCTGNSAIKCGGQWRNTVYSATDYPGSRYIGCFADSLVDRAGHRSSYRTLTGMRQDDVNGMDGDKCIGICHNNGYKISAVQAGYACFCGNSGVDKYGGERNEEECNTVCPGNPDQMCGGAWRNSVYTTGI